MQEEQLWTDAPKASTDFEMNSARLTLLYIVDDNFLFWIPCSCCNLQCMGPMACVSVKKNHALSCIRKQLLSSLQRHRSDNKDTFCF